MISNLLPEFPKLPGGGSSGKQSTTLPRDVKDAVSKCRAAVQTSLGDRLSRIDVEFPVGTKFGVEKDQKKRGKKGRRSFLDDDIDVNSDNGGSDGDGVTTTVAPGNIELDSSDRELARIFVEMFQPVGGDSISVIFRDTEQAERATEIWKDDPSATCRISNFSGGSRKDRRGSGKKKKKGGKKGGGGGGFATKFSRELGKDDDDVDVGASGSSGGPLRLAQCEVALFVSPGPRELVEIERICAEVGMGTLVILLNARLGLIASRSENSFSSPESEKLFSPLEDGGFESVFHLAAAPQDVAPGCLLHRAYPNGWALARKPKIGPPKTIGTYETKKPTKEECAKAYGELKISDIEKGVENALGNVAGWFK